VLATEAKKAGVASDYTLLTPGHHVLLAWKPVATECQTKQNL